MRFKEEIIKKPKEVPVPVLFFAVLYHVVKMSLYVDLFYFVLYGCMTKDIKALYAFVSVFIFKKMFQRLLVRTIIYQQTRITIRNYLDGLISESKKEEASKKIKRFLFSKN